MLRCLHFGSNLDRVIFLCSCEFLEKTPDANIVKMDSVIGEKRGKCLLTIHFVECSFMLAFLRNANTSKSVTDIFDLLHQTLGHELFKKLFPVILTDNGSELSKFLFKLWFLCNYIFTN